MNSSLYSHLKPRIKTARIPMRPRYIDVDEAEEILHRPVDLDQLTDAGIDEKMLDEGEALETNTTDFMSRNLESFVSLASQPTTATAFSPLWATMEAQSGMGGVGPSPGSSLRARKHPKRLASEVPGGAATPVAKRRRGESGGVEGDLKGDGAFLGGL